MGCIIFVISNISVCILEKKHKKNIEFSLGDKLPWVYQAVIAITRYLLQVVYQRKE